MTRLFVPVIHGAAAKDRPDEADTLANAQAIKEALERLGYASEIVEIDLDLTALDRLAARRPHAVFNLYEGTRGDGRLSQLPCAVMDHLGVPYTGAHAEAFFLTLTKTLTKRMLRANGLPTADWWPTGEGAEGEAKVIVKSDAEHASFGIDAGSVVAGKDAAREIAARERRFGGRFLAEAFVEGREFNAAMLETPKNPPGGPRVLPIPEIPFDDLPPGRPRIVDYEAKWDEGSAAYRATTRRFGLERSDPALAAQLADLARRCWDAFGLRGYARVDMRVSEQGEPFILEVNANPCLAPDAGFASTAREAGMGFDQLIGTIVEAAVSGEGAGKPLPLHPLATAFRHLERSRSSFPSPLVGEGAGGSRQETLWSAAPPPDRPLTPPPPPQGGREDRSASAPLAWRTEPAPADIAAVTALVTGTGFFTPAEIAIAGELVEERLRDGAACGYHFVFAEAGGSLRGYACYGDIPGSDASYDLYWIAVVRDGQRRGLGREILRQVEDEVAKRGGLALYADTSASALYEPTRAFYLGAGFAIAAELPDFYRRGDGKVIFRKAIGLPSPP